MKWSTFIDDHPGPVSLVLPGLHGGIVDAPQIVDGEEVHTLNRSHIILDVAGLGDIDEDQVAGARIEWPEALLMTSRIHLRG